MSENVDQTNIMSHAVMLEKKTKPGHVVHGDKLISHLDLNFTQMMDSLCSSVSGQLRTHTVNMNKMFRNIWLIKQISMCFSSSSIIAIIL